MRSYAPAMETLQWQTLTPQHMPPIGEDFLLWMDIDKNDGGYPTLARRIKQKGDRTTICPVVYLLTVGFMQGPILPENEYANCRWAAIAPPKCVIRKRIKEKQKRMELMERYENQA